MPIHRSVFISIYWQRRDGDKVHFQFITYNDELTKNIDDKT